jgi:CRISPR system Cascade subunit CasD
VGGEALTTLLLLLEGPLQAWGVGPRMEFRDTAPLPTKSGVVGLLANALGRRRTDPIDDLARLRMGVAVLRPGRLLVDLQAVLDVATVGGGTKNKLTRRRYLMDASFLVGLEGGRETLVKLHEALADPARPLYLGRRGCFPSPPPYLPDGLVPSSLEEALGERLRGMKLSRPVPLVLESREGGEVVLDVPVDFVSRALAPRWVRRTTWHPEGSVA